MPRRPVAQLAFPEFTTIARTTPPVETSVRRPISTGAATTRFCVNNAAAAAPSTASIRAKSSRPLTLMPAATAEKENPPGRRLRGAAQRDHACIFMLVSSASFSAAAESRKRAPGRGLRQMRSVLSL